MIAKEAANERQQTGGLEMNILDWNHQYADVNGVRLHYVRHGSGMPLILLHGWPEFWFAWHKNIPVLSDSFDVVVPDLRGFGNSEKPDSSAAEAYTLDHHVADLLGLIDALGFEQVGIVSHDIGAMVAQSFARQYPERLTGLFFFNLPYPGIGSRWAEPEHLNEIWYQGFHQQPWAVELLATSRDAIRVYFGNMLAHWAYDKHAFDEDLEAWVDNFAAPGNLQGGFNWYAAIFPLRLAMIRGEAPASPPIDTPTRVRWGKHEPFMLVEYADRLPEYFSNLDFKPVPDAGHFVHYERPDYANREITDFFKQLAS